MKRKQRLKLLSALGWLGLSGVLVWLATGPHHRQVRSLPAETGASVAIRPAAEAEPVIPATGTPPAVTAAGGKERTLPATAPATGPPAPNSASIPVPPIHRPGGAPEIAILIDDVGLDLRGSRRAADLPPAVTLSYMPYATRLREQTQAARAQGHELMLHMPMEPLGADDPGPGALLTGLPPDDLRQRLDTALASFIGFDGVNNHMGSKFTADAAGMALVMGELQPRHLFFLDSRTSAQSVGFATAQRFGVPALTRDVFLDDEISAAAVRRQLAQTEHIAMRQGYAIAIGHPHPATLQALADWLPQAQARGFVFVPVHDLIAATNSR